MHDQYRSPGDLIKQHPYVVNLVLHAYKTLGLKTKVIPFRGGTDGDFISEKEFLHLIYLMVEQISMDHMNM